tara:strand:- start:1958 stop:2218 length:261 start_codon:yes stop_codon:yes gene_type:complete
VKRKRKSTGEAIVFYEIWNERQHICENCKIYLGDDARTWFFSHIKPKGKYPELRLEKNNIQLLCYDCHYAHDFKTKEKYNARFKEQ